MFCSEWSRLLCVFKEGIPYNCSFGCYFVIPSDGPKVHKYDGVGSAKPLIHSMRTITTSMRESINALLQDLACSGVEFADSTPGTRQVRHSRGTRDGHIAGTRVLLQIP